MSETSNIGFVESKMNELIFKPPNREYFNSQLNNKSEKPHYIKIFECKDESSNTDQQINLSYFVIHPVDRNRSYNPYILWSHGNGSDLMELYPIIKNLHTRLSGQIGIIVYDYEGYGLSSGQSREINCYRNLDMMIEFCKTRLNIPLDRLFLLGHSLGTGVVINYVSKITEWKTPIILLSPYKSISRVLVDPHWTDILTNFIVNCIDRFKSIDKIENITCPIVIYHGMRDTLIDYHHSIELRKKNKTRTTLILIKRAGHNDILNHIDPKEIWNIVFNHINSKSEDR